jgi:methyltransferase (TIGR00027 family)
MKERLFGGKEAQEERNFYERKASEQNGTAGGNARAAHQLLDFPKVFDDPVALRIIGKESALALRTDPRQSETSPLSPYLRAFAAARSRYAEDELALGVQRGVSQYVILGAGLDTFAYRNAYPEGVLHVFEIDHPTTQIWKRDRLREIGIALPRDLTFAPVDFETQTLAEGLQGAGYNGPRNLDRVTCYTWERKRGGPSGEFEETASAVV